MSGNARLDAVATDGCKASVTCYAPTSSHGGMSQLSDFTPDGWVRATDYAAMQAKLDAVTKERDALRSALNPQNWTSEMSTAWHLNIPDLQKAFEELTKAALTDQGRAGEEKQ